VTSLLEVGVFFHFFETVGWMIGKEHLVCQQPASVVFQLPGRFPLEAEPIMETGVAPERNPVAERTSERLCVFRTTTKILST